MEKIEEKDAAMRGGILPKNRRHGRRFLGKKTVSKYVFVGTLMFYPILLWLIFYVYVNFNSIVMSFQNIAIDGKTSWAGLSNFKNFLAKAFDGSDQLAISLLNTLKYYVLTTVITLPIYFGVSFYFYKCMPASRIFRAFMMLPSIVSGFIMALVFKKFVEIGLPGIWGGITGKDPNLFPNLLYDPDFSFGTILFYDIWLSFTAGFIYYPNAMRNIDPSIVESARMDGAGYWKEFWHITMPLIYPTFTTFFVLSVAGFFGTSGSLLLFYMYSAPPETSLIGYYYTVMVLDSPTQTGYPILAAGGLVMTAIAAPLTFLVKFLMERYGPNEG